jgi:hypothetical protein
MDGAPPGWDGILTEGQSYTQVAPALRSIGVSPERREASSDATGGSRHLVGQMRVIYNGEISSMPLIHRFLLLTLE